jgi:pyrroline-5-carboxylate reductase
MAQSLLIPLLEKGEIRPESVRAVVGTSASAELLQSQIGISVSTDPGSAWDQPVLLLAIKPQQLQQVAATAPPFDPVRPPLLVSVLAGVTLKRLQQCFPHARAVRAVPNTPCLVRAGITGLAWGPAVEPQQREQLRRWFEALGQVIELPEGQMDGFLALASSGPAMAALVIEALADGGVAAGLPRSLAQDTALAMLAGSVTLLREHGLHPGQLKDLVASPAGTTVAALRRLEEGGVRSALIEAVLAAAERSRALAES